MVLSPPPESGTKVQYQLSGKCHGKGRSERKLELWLAGRVGRGRNPVSRKSGKVGTFIVRRKRSKTVVRTLSVTRIVNVNAPGLVGAR